MDYVWLGFHIPDPINHTNIRVWSDCSVAESSNWNLESPLPTDITDTSLCTVLHTSSHYWYPAVCNEQNYFICIGDYGTVLILLIHIVIPEIFVISNKFCFYKTHVALIEQSRSNE